MTQDQEERFQLISADWAGAHHDDDLMNVALHNLRDILDDPDISPDLRVRVQRLRIRITHYLQPGGLDGSMF